MAEAGADRIRRMRLINVVIQVVLVIIVAVAAMKFQAGLAAQGRPQRFLHACVIAVFSQLALLYPLYLGAGVEAKREFASMMPNLSGAQIQDLRRKRIFADFLKGVYFIFFITFILKAPADMFIMATILFVFILTMVTYLQCLNRRLKMGQ